MASAAPKLIPPGPTSDEIPEVAIPDTCEVIDGELVEKETSGEHGRAQSRLVIRVGGPYDRRPGGRYPGGWWFATEALIDFGGGQKLRPDVAGWRRDKTPAPPSGAIIRIMPDWICEVLSPSNRGNDTVKKLRSYHKRAVGHYWLLDPTAETLEVYRWQTDGYLRALSAERGERVRAEPFEAIELSIAGLFGDDDDQAE